MSGLNFIDYINKNPDCVEHHLSIFERNPIPSCNLHQFPLILEPKVLDSLVKASTSVISLIKCVHEKIFKNDKASISKYFDIDISLLDLALSNESMDNILYRPDFVKVDETWKCLEINSGNAGGWVISIVMPLYKQLPLLKELRDLSFQPYDTVLTLFTNLIRDAIEKISPTPDEEINTSIIISREEKNEFNDKVFRILEELYQLALQKVSVGLKGSLFFSEFNDLNVNSEQIFLNQTPINIVYEEAIQSSNLRMKAIRLSNKNKIILNPGLITRFLNDKRHFAALSEHVENRVFSDSEKSNIKKYIPWTRKLIDEHTQFYSQKIHIPSFTHKNKDKLVIKKAFSHGGSHVYMGKNIIHAKWTDIVRDAVDQKDWIVQELVPLQPDLLYSLNHSCAKEYDLVWGPFIIKDRYAGGFVRILDPDKYKASSDNPSMINTGNSDESIYISPIISYKCEKIK